MPPHGPASLTGASPACSFGPSTTLSYRVSLFRTPQQTRAGGLNHMHPSPTPEAGAPVTRPGGWKSPPRGQQGGFILCLPPWPAVGVSSVHSSAAPCACLHPYLLLVHHRSVITSQLSPASYYRPVITSWSSLSKPLSGNFSSPISSSYCITRGTGSGSTPTTSFYLDGLIKDPFSECSHILRSWGWGFSVWICGGHSPAITAPKPTSPQSPWWPPRSLLTHVLGTELGTSALCPAEPDSIAVSSAHARDPTALILQSRTSRLPPPTLTMQLLTPQAFLKRPSDP